MWQLKLDPMTAVFVEAGEADGKNQRCLERRASEG